MDTPNLNRREFFLIRLIDLRNPSWKFLAYISRMLGNIFQNSWLPYSFLLTKKEKKISLRSIDIWNGLHGHGAVYVYKETKGNWAAQKAYPNYGVCNDNYAPGNLL